MPSAGLKPGKLGKAKAVRPLDASFDEYQAVEGEKITYKAAERVAAVESKTEEFRQQIRDNMVLLVYGEIFEALDSKKELKALLEKNKLLWAKILLRSKNFQELIAEMVERARYLIDKEFKYNSPQIDQFLAHPRPYDSRLKLVPPPARALLPHETNPKFNESPLARRMEQLREREEAAQRQSLRHILAQPVKRTTYVAPKTKQPPEELVKMKAKLKEIDALMETLEETNESLGYGLDEFDDKSAKHNTARLERFATVGMQVEQKLEEIAAYHPPSHDDLQYYVEEGWKEYATFEKMLASQKEEHALEVRQSQHAFLRQIDWIKRKTAFRIKALETALVEVKLQKRTLLERQAMQEAERESQEFNDHIRLQEIELHVKDSFDIAEVGSLDLARKRLQRLDKMVKTLNKRLAQVTKDLKNEKRKTQSLSEQLAEGEARLAAVSATCARYRQTLRDIVGHTQLFKNQARQDQLAQTLQLEGDDEHLALDYFRDNPVEDIVGPIRRDNTVLRQRMQEVVARLKKERVLSKSSLKKKDLEKQYVISGELRVFLQNSLHNFRLRQILALKEGQDAVGLLEEPLEIREEEEDSLPDEEMLDVSEVASSSIRPSSRKAKIRRLKSKISDNLESRTSSNLKSPASTREGGGGGGAGGDQDRSRSQTRVGRPAKPRNMTIAGHPQKSLMGGGAKKRGAQAKAVSKSAVPPQREQGGVGEWSKASASASIPENSDAASFSRYVDQEDEEEEKSSKNVVVVSHQTLGGDSQHIEIALKTPAVQPDSDDETVHENVIENMQQARPAPPPVFLATPLDFYKKLKLGPLKHMRLDRRDSRALQHQNFRVALEKLNGIILDYQ